MQRLVAAALASVGVGFALASVTRAAEEPSWRCARPPIEPCVECHGRLSSQQGIALRLWLIGTTRVLSIENDFETDMPPIVEKYLEITSDDHSYIYGDFQVCPLSPDQPGHTRAACISGATRLVVQNLRRERPPFKLSSTWSSTGKD